MPTPRTVTGTLINQKFHKVTHNSMENMGSTLIFNKPDRGSPKERPHKI